MSRISYSLAAAFTLLTGKAFGPPEPTDRKTADRGDVPGWVMITVMTAILVIALLAVFKEQVIAAVQNAFSDVDDQRG